MPDSVELSYVAGFFDGEGCVHIARQRAHPGGVTYINYYLRVDIANTNKDILIWISGLFGYGSVTKKGRKGNRKQGWSLVIVSRQAASFLTDISPYVKVKRGQVALGIEFQKTKGKRKSEYQGGNTEDVLKQRLSISEQMSQLNRRGAIEPEVPAALN